MVDTESNEASVPSAASWFVGTARRCRSTRSLTKDYEACEEPAAVDRDTLATARVVGRTDNHTNDPIAEESRAVTVCRNWAYT
jgi:hypothetical protein